MISIKDTLRSRWIWGIAVTALIVISFVTRAKWWEPAQNWVRNTISSSRKVSSLDSHDHSGAGEADPHAHEGHDDGTSLTLSAQAQGNIGLALEYLKPVKLETFRRSITVPAIIIGRPGRSRLEISAPHEHE